MIFGDICCILHGKSFCLLQLLHTSFIGQKCFATLFPLVSYTHETCGLFLYWFIQNLGLLTCIFAIGRICARSNSAPTAPYVVHLLKLHFHSVSLGKLCKWNMWTVPVWLYLKAEANICIQDFEIFTLISSHNSRFPTIYRPLHVILVWLGTSLPM